MAKGKSKVFLNLSLTIIFISQNPPKIRHTFRYQISNRRIKMSLVTFPLRIQPEVKQAICDLAKVKNQTQTDLIREAILAHLLNQNIQKKQSTKKKH